jgi:hypothetical protein
LAAKLGNTTTVAPQTDNVYTIGADMGPTAFKKGQDMLREEAGDPVVAELMEVLECMSGFGNNTDRRKDNTFKQATKTCLKNLRDQFVAKFPLEQAAGPAVPPPAAAAPAPAVNNSRRRISQDGPEHEENEDSDVREEEENADVGGQDPMQDEAKEDSEDDVGGLVPMQPDENDSTRMYE